MKAYIFLLEYNNYFDRTVKKAGDDLGHYLDMDCLSHVAEKVNFAPNDELEASIVINSDANCDYALVIDSEEYPERTAAIASRWFVTSHVRSRAGQWTYSLKRDVLADNYDAVKSAPCFVEKGVPPIGSPLVYNEEGLGFNQIKTGETLLKDASAVPWIVGYVAKDAYVDPIELPAPSDIDYIEVAAKDIDSWEYGGYRTSDFVSNLKTANFKTQYARGPNFIYRDGWQSTVDESGGFSTSSYERSRSGRDFELAVSRDQGTYEVGQKLMVAYQGLGLGSFTYSLGSYIGAHTESETRALLAYDGKTIRLTNGKYYRISVYQSSAKMRKEGDVTSASMPNLYSLMNQAVADTGLFDSSHKVGDDDSYDYDCTYATYRISAAEIPTLSTKTKLSATRQHTKDALYDVFCMPYGDITVSDATIGEFGISKEIELQAAIALSTKLSSGLYDIQILPYCPLTSQISEGKIATQGKEGVAYDWITTSSGAKTGVLFYVPYCNFSTVIEAPEFIERPHSKELADAANVSSTSSEFAITSFDGIAGSETLVAGIYYGLQPQTLRPNITVRKRRKSDDEQIGEWLCAQVAVGYQTQSDLSNSFRFKTLAETIEVSEAEYLAADYYYTFKSEGLTKVYNSSTPLKRCCKKLALTYDNLVQEDVKIANECVAHRLVSPNYQGEFEFSVAKNEGVDRYNVTCTYKPYNPYIHVAPNFKGLYGSDFGDGRGLICNGDFSLGQLTSQFAEYELQNKNYQSIFARQIQSMDAMNKIANQESLVSAVTGTVQGTSSGAMTGGLVGGGAGAVVGGVLGGVTSGVAGYADYANSIRRQKESRSLAWDNYNYNLQNVKAIPYSLTKCTAMTYDNKIFPFVERYDATDEEKKALLGKLRWDGMTIMAVGTLEDCLQKPGGFVKGEILRLDSLNLPSDLSYAIYDEIRKGAYLY